MLPFFKYLPQFSALPRQTVILKKGNKVAIVGSLQNRSYEDKDGIKRNVTDVVASEVEFLTPKGSQGEEDAPVVSVKRERPQLEAIDDNKLPF